MSSTLWIVLFVILGFSLSSFIISYRKWLNRRMEDLSDIHNFLEDESTACVVIEFQPTPNGGVVPVYQLTDVSSSLMVTYAKISNPDDESQTQEIFGVVRPKGAHFALHLFDNGLLLLRKGVGRIKPATFNHAQESDINLLMRRTRTVAHHFM